MDAGMSSINASMVQSMMEGEHKIELILHWMKRTHDKFDLSTARTFTDQFRQRLDAVFKRFIENTNFDENLLLNLGAVGSSSITPAKITIANGQGNNNDGDEKKIDINSEMDDDDAGSNSDTVWICDSDDDDSVFVSIEKHSRIISQKNQAHNQDRNDSRFSKLGRMPPIKTPTRFSLRQRTIKHHHSSCTACELNQKHSSPTKKQRNKCEVCKKVFCSSYDLQVHRISHLMPDTIHCCVCLHIFDGNDEKMKHESKCKLLRYECYLCHKTLRDRSQCTKHLRWHTTGNKALRKH